MWRSWESSPHWPDNPGPGEIMPIVTVHWLAGRTPTQKTTTAVRLTEVVADVGRVDPSDVSVICVDIEREDWMIGATAKPNQPEDLL